MRISAIRLITAAALVMFFAALAGHATAQTAFVINRGLDEVKIVDSSTKLVNPTSISVGDKPTELALTPDGQSLYVTNTFSNTISIIDVASLAVVGSITAQGSPWGIVISPNGKSAYVSDVFQAVVGVLDLGTNTFGPTISNASLDTPQGMAITPDGSLVYVANVAFQGNPSFGSAPENVTVIATATNTVVTTVDVSALVRDFGPWDVTTLPDGSKAYSNDGDNGEHVFEIDTATNTVDDVDIAVTPGDRNGPRGMESGMTPVGVRVYAALAETDEFVVIDPVTNAIVQRVPTGSGSFPWRVRLNPDGTELWVSLRDKDEVRVYDTSNNTLITSISGFNRPADIAFLEDPPVTVGIDIKPGSDPNSINLCSNGAVPLAILGSDTFDVLDVNTETLRFAEAAVKVVARKSPHYLCSYEDVNGDFIDDVVCHFMTADMAAIDGESITATVNGELLDGTPIEGTDSVNIVKDTCN